MISFLYDSITLLSSLNRWLYAFGLVFSFIFLLKVYAWKPWHHRLALLGFSAWGLSFLMFLGSFYLLKQPSTYSAGQCFRQSFSEAEQQVLADTKEALKLPLSNLPGALKFARKELLKSRVKNIHNRAKQIIVVATEGKHNFFVEKRALESWDEAQLGVDFHLYHLRLESVECSASAIFVMNSITLPPNLKQVLLSKSQDSIHLGKKPASLEK